MAADNVVGIDIVARLDAFRSELGKIPDIGAKEAKALTAQLSREIKAAERAAEKGAKASRDASRATKQMGDAASRAADQHKQATDAVRGFGNAAGSTGSSAGKLAGALDLIAPGAGEAARSVADLADVGEVAAAASGALGVSLGTLAAVALPIAAIVSGVALAWAGYSAQAKDAAEFQERLNVALDEVDGISSRTQAEIDKLRVNIGQLTEAEYDDLQIQRDFAALRESGTAKLREEQTALEEKMAAIGTANAEYLKLQDRLHEVNGLIETANTLNAQGEEAAKANAMFARERAESERVLSERLKAKAEADRLSAEAATDSAEAERVRSEAVADEAARVKSLMGAYAAFEEVTHKADASQLEGIERLQAERDAQFAAITVQQQAALEAALGSPEAIAEADRLSAEARDAVWRAYYDRVADYNAKLYAGMDADREKDEAAEAARLARLDEMTWATANSVAGAVGSLAEVVADVAEEGTEKQKQLALVAFRISQAAAVAQATITATKMALDAYAAALELGPAGLAIAPFAAAGAGAVGFAQVAAIAATPPPSFHAGLAPDEVPATLTRGEGVLTPRGVASMGGSEGVRRANRGEGPASRQIVVVQQFKHRVLDAAVDESLQMPTSPLRRAIRAGRRVGHRRRT